MNFRWNVMLVLNINCFMFVLSVILFVLHNWNFVPLVLSVLNISQCLNTMFLLKNGRGYTISILHALQLVLNPKLSEICIGEFWVV